MYMNSSAFVEATFDWDNLPGNTESPDGIVNMNQGGTGWYGYSIPLTIQGWIDGSITNYGLKFNESNNGFRKWSSSEGSYCPYLDITYSMPGGGGIGIGSPWIFMKDALDKGKKYSKEKGLFLPNDRLFKPELVY